MTTPVARTDWSPSEAASINEFLNTPLGNKWLIKIMLRKPRLDLSSTERAALSGAFIAGYENVFAVIDEMRRPHAPLQDASAKPIDPERD
jgi:hypothetical protein